RLQGHPGGALVLVAGIGPLLALDLFAAARQRGQDGHQGKQPKDVQGTQRPHCILPNGTYATYSTYLPALGFTGAYFPIGKSPSSVLPALIVTGMPFLPLIPSL